MVDAANLCCLCSDIHAILLWVTWGYREVETRMWLVVAMTVTNAVKVLGVCVLLWSGMAETLESRDGPGIDSADATVMRGGVSVACNALFRTLHGRLHAG